MTAHEATPVFDFIRRLALLPERAMRRREIRRWLWFNDPMEVSDQLQTIVEECLKASDEARTAQLAWVDFLLFTDEDDELPLEALELAAEKQGNRAAILLLSDPPPHRQLKERFRQSFRLAKPIPLGMRKWQAVLNNPRTLEALLADPDPSVIAKLCQNPNVREADVLTMVSRRPNFSDVLDTVARSRWLQRQEIRRALIQNPYVRTGLAINLLPQNGPRFLATLRYSSDLHPRLLEAVEYFLSFCPQPTRSEETT